VLLASSLLIAFSKLPSFELSRQNVIQLLDVLLSLVQQSCPYSYESIEHLAKPEFTALFQKAYLAYETDLEIAEATTLLMSRVMMVTRAEVEFSDEFVRAIKLRAKAMGSEDGGEGDDSEDLLKGNINCLLTMIYV
jgi:hypothetical protein